MGTDAARLLRRVCFVLFFYTILFSLLVCARAQQGAEVDLMQGGMRDGWCVPALCSPSGSKQVLDGSSLCK